MRFKGKKPVVSRKDTYSLDRVLAPVIHAGLVKFVEVLRQREAEGYCYGVPLDFYNQETQEVDQEAWFKALDQMVYAFADYKDIFDNSTPSNKAHHKKVTKGLKLFAKHYESLWW